MNQVVLPNVAVSNLKDGALPFRSRERGAAGKSRAMPFMTMAINCCKKGSCGLNCGCTVRASLDPFEMHWCPCIVLSLISGPEASYGEGSKREGSERGLILKGSPFSEGDFLFVGWLVAK